MVNLHHGERLGHLVATSNGTKGIVRGLRPVPPALDQPRVEAADAHNAYAQDNQISWVDWRPPNRSRRLIGFVQKLCALVTDTRCCDGISF
jgi:hypothetical protein